MDCQGVQEEPKGRPGGPRNPKTARGDPLALLQASRQSGLDRPYQDHLGGLDKAYKSPLKKLFKPFKKPFKSLLKSFKGPFKWS